MLATNPNPNPNQVGDVGPLRTRGETCHGRVRLLSPRGAPQRDIGVDYPRGIASDGEHLFVVNSVRDTLQKVLTLTLTLTLSLTPTPTQP